VIRNYGHAPAPPADGLPPLTVDGGVAYTTAGQTGDGPAALSR
jgi:hypothetical protein